MGLEPDIPATVTATIDASGDLLARVAAGDRDSIATLVRQWEQPLLRIAYRIVGRLDEAEDVRQTILLRILESPQWLPEADRFAAWIRRCVINESIARLRRRDVQRRAGETAAELAGMRSLFSVSEEVTRAEDADRLQRALTQLDAETRTLLTLRFDEDLTFREIAEVLEQPASTVKLHLAAAIARLRSLLGSSSRPETDR